MKCAYAEFRRVSETLDGADPPAEESSTGESAPLATMEGRHRAALVRYLEARMGLLEYRFDEANRLAGPERPAADDTEQSAIRAWLASANGRRLFPMLAAVLLCVTVSYAVREQKQVRDLETGRDELRATLNQTREQVRLLGQRMDGWKPEPDAALPQVEQTPRASSASESGTVPRAAGQKPPGQAHRGQESSRHVPQKQAAVRREAVLTTPKQSIAHNSVNFSMTPSRQFKRVGPIGLSLRSVDARRKQASVSIVSATVDMNLTHVQVKRPVRIILGPNQQVELVIDRIAGNRLEGHLRELGSERQDPTSP